MYFNLRNKFVKRKKIRKTFVNLLNFCGTMRDHNVSNRFQNTNLQFHFQETLKLVHHLRIY